MSLPGSTHEWGFLMPRQTPPTVRNAEKRRVPLRSLHSFPETTLALADVVYAADDWEDNERSVDYAHRLAISLAEYGYVIVQDGEAADDFCAAEMSVVRDGERLQWLTDRKKMSLFQRRHESACPDCGQDHDEPLCNDQADAATVMQMATLQRADVEDDNINGQRTEPIT